MAGPADDGSLLTLTVKREGDNIVVCVRGELDFAGAPSFQRCIEGLVESQVSDVVVDLGEVEFIDSVGIAALVRAFRRLKKAGGTFALRSPSQVTTQVLEITGLDKLLRII